jgi:peptidoglycan/LPS O-acetylase OafA/YrhL
VLDRTRTRRGAPPIGRIRQLDSLTSLRFAAALAVFANHAADALRPSGAGEGELLQSGFVGVTFFFVLSGFVLTWAAVPGEAPAAFYRNRVARIVPAYLAAWALALLLAVATHAELRGLGVATSLVLVQAWHPSPDVHFAVSPVAWTLSVEAFFYLAFPFVVGPLGRLSHRRRALAVGACVGASFAWAALGYRLEPEGRDWVAYVFPLARLPEFLLGVLLAHEVLAGRWRRVRLGPALAVTVLAVAAGLAVPPAFRVAVVPMLPFALLIAAAAHADSTGAPAPVLRARALVVLGGWSYAFYLLHELVLRGSTTWLGLGDDLPGTAAVAVACALLVVAVAASGLLVRLVERPAQARLRARRPPPSVAPDARCVRSVRQ